MALIKNIKNHNGTETNYHKISKVILAPKAKRVLVKERTKDTPAEYATERVYEAEITVRSYVSHDIRETGERNYLNTRRFECELSVADAESKAAFVACYDALKTLPEFEGAENA